MPCHPLGRLLETLVDVYRASYVGMGAHSRLLPHAVEEIKSYIDRVYAILRYVYQITFCNNLLLKQILSGFNCFAQSKTLCSSDFTNVTKNGNSDEVFFLTGTEF